MMVSESCKDVVAGSGEIELDEATFELPGCKKILDVYSKYHHVSEPALVIAGICSAHEPQYS